MSKKKGWHKGRGKAGPTRPGKINTNQAVISIFPPGMPVRHRIVASPRYATPGLGAALDRLQTRTGRQVGLPEALSGARPYARADDMTGEEVLASIDSVFKRDARSEIVFGTLSGMLSQALGYDVDRYQIIVRKTPRADAVMVRINWNREE